MGARRRGTAIVMVVALTLPLALPAAASTTRTGATTTTERPEVERADPPEIVVRPVLTRPEVEVKEPPVVDRPVVDRPDVDRPDPDRPDQDRPTVRSRCEVDVNPDRCDRVHLRQLIWRLIKAGEWRLLFHLLVRLGII